jgi:hypothetical protein
MFSNNHSKTKLLDSNLRGSYYNYNLTDYFDTPLSFTSPAMRAGALAREGSGLDLYEPI